MGRSISRRSNSFSSSCEGSKGDCAVHSTSHNSRSLVRRSRGAGHENSCSDGGKHVGSCTEYRRRKYSLSPSSITGNSKYSKARYVNSSKRSHHHLELQERRTHVRYHEQDELALQQARIRSFSEPRLRFSPSTSSSTSLERKFQRSATVSAQNQSFLAAQDCGDIDQDFLKSSCNQDNHTHFSRLWRDFDGAHHDFSSKRSCYESRLGFCHALFDMFLALVLSLCGKKSICLRDLWNSTAGGGGGGNGWGRSGKEERGLGRMQLVTVSMLGSMDWVRVVVRSDASVRATIKAVLKAFASQKRMPPNGSDPDAYHLHYSAFSIQCLDSDDLVENLGARSFVLCPGPFITPQDRSLCSSFNRGP